MLPYVKQLVSVLSERLGWNRSRLKLMARPTGALPIQTTTNLAQLTQVMKPQVETDSTYRRLQRFFAGFAFGYEALGQFLLELVPTDPPYVVVIDRTEWHFSQTAVNVLMIGVAYEGIAFPVAWTALDHGGGSGADEHTEVLEQFLRVVQPDQIRALVADREFTGSDFLEVLKERKVPFVIRLKSDRRVGPASGEWSLPARMFARTCGVQQSSLLGGRQVVGGAETTGVQIGLKRLEDGSFLILASRGGDPFDRAGPNQKATRRSCPDLQLDPDCWSGSEKTGRSLSRVRQRVSGEKPVSVWTGSAPRTVGQLVSDARGAKSVCSGAHRSALIFVV